MLQIYCVLLYNRGGVQTAILFKIDCGLGLWTVETHVKLLLFWPLAYMVVLIETDNLSHSRRSDCESWFAFSCRTG